MVSVDVVDFGKKKVSTVDLADGILNVAVKTQALQEVVRWQLACRRAGTVATKTKGMVRGGGKKPFKQKGTGNARQGSSRSPLMPGGGTAFGPQPRDYSYTLPRAVKKNGVKVALSYLHSQGKFFVLNDLECEGRTGALAKNLKKLGLESSIIVDSEGNNKLKRATRNLPFFKFIPPMAVNVFDLLKYDGCIVTAKGLQELVERLKG